jgi:SAM-dependent methyltransferase
VQEGLVLTFTAATLEALTGLPVDASSREAIFRDLPELRYTPVDHALEQKLFAEIEDVIAQRRFRVIGAAEDQGVWEKGWAEVAAQVRAAEKVDVETLKPQYFHLGVPFRLLGQYVIPETAYFEYYAGVAVRRQLMRHFFTGSASVLELGCGTGINLLLAADLFPQAALAGSDWTQATLDILTALGEAKRRPIKPFLFNMLDQNGCGNLPLSPDTDVLTVHALEQLGDQAGTILDLLVERRVRRCLHIEPVLEFYDSAKAFDDIARRYHLARNYLQDLRPKLQRLAAAGKVEILDERRVPLGNKFHEAYSYIAWRPL